MRRRGTPGTFRRHCFQSCVYSDETTWRPRWKIPIEHPWRRDFRDSKFQNVPRCLGPQKRAPLVRVPKPPTIHYQPATEKLFDSPAEDKAAIHNFLYPVLENTSEMDTLF